MPTVSASSCHRSEAIETSAPPCVCGHPAVAHQDPHRTGIGCTTPLSTLGSCHCLIYVPEPASSPPSVR